jgi:hypothetical protein
MAIPIFACVGGTLVLPDASLLLVSRENGGNLVVNPPVPVWERSELTREQLMYWSFLVAAAGRAMLESLPQLEGGCINYWEAGNWALNEQAEPVGRRKTAKEFRKVHLHLLGRSRMSQDPSWKWGESPIFPRFHERDSWSVKYKRLTVNECCQIVERAEFLLKNNYGLSSDEISGRWVCEQCGYPTIQAPACLECS